DPGECAGQHHVRHDHEREELPRGLLGAEQVRQLGVVVMEQHAVNGEAADHPGYEHDEPGEHKLPVHVPSPSLTCCSADPAAQSSYKVPPERLGRMRVAT